MFFRFTVCRLHPLEKPMFYNDWLNRRSLYTPDRIAVVDDLDGERYTYAALNARAIRVASYLQHRLGVSPGDRVACVSGNRLEYLDLYFACGKIGAVLVPINVRLPSASILELLEDCQPMALVYEQGFDEVADAARQAGVITHGLAIDSATPLVHIPSLAQIIADSATPPTVCPFVARESDTAMILFTSGTTGRAKGAMIPYRQIHWNVLNTIIGLQLTQKDTAFLNMPLHHTGGWHVLFTPLMLLGGRVILQRQFDPCRCNELLGPEEVTILFGVPTTLRMIQQAPNFSKADFSSVRFAIFGGESCPLPLIEAYAARGVAMRQGYGLTEAGPNCFSLPGEDAIRKQGSIGLPNFHIAARLVDQNGNDVAVGEVGELLMKGPHVFSGYWANAAESDRAIQDGWLATGDLMKRDSEDYYYFVGRKKDMYVSGGENVYPAHVERILQTHEAISLAAVVSVPDSRWGETGWAFISLHADQTLDQEELLNWCRQRLARFQCPARIIVQDELPLGPSGKIDKLVLQQRAAEMIGS
jgi:fatty-acyl-CoA synthase